MNVVGTSGSGKSTFSQQLAERLNFPYIEMDRLHWLPNWQESTDEQLIEKLQNRIDCSQWILDGNYTRTIPTKWSQADTVIWLDYSFSCTLYRAIKRAFKRALSGREVWPGTGNVETFKQLFCSKDSMILWTMMTYHKNRRKYLALMADERYSNIRFVHLRSTKAADRFIQTILS